MKNIDIKNLYIAEVGKFQFFKFVANNPQMEYKKLKSYSFYYKDKHTYVDIFSGDRYTELKYSTVQKNDIGLIEPKKYNQMFMDTAVKKIEQNGMFSISELKDIARHMKKEVIWGSIWAEKILLEREIGEEIFL